MAYKPYRRPINPQHSNKAFATLVTPRHSLAQAEARHRQSQPHDLQILSQPSDGIRGKPGATSWAASGLALGGMEWTSTWDVD
jgi:hypothetical protein